MNSEDSLSIGFYQNLGKLFYDIAEEVNPIAESFAGKNKSELILCTNLQNDLKKINS